MQTSLFFFPGLFAYVVCHCDIPFTVKTRRKKNKEKFTSLKTPLLHPYSTHHYIYIHNTDELSGREGDVFSGCWQLTACTAFPGSGQQPRPIGHGSHLLSVWVHLSLTSSLSLHVRGTVCVFNVCFVPISCPRGGGEWSVAVLSGCFYAKLTSGFGCCTRWSVVYM